MAYTGWSAAPLAVHLFEVEWGSGRRGASVGAFL